MNMNSGYIDSNFVITQVKKRPLIFDSRIFLYKDRDARTQAWNDIATELHSNFYDMSPNERMNIVDGLKKRWRSLADTFKREYKPENQKRGKRKKKYHFYDQLMFLAPFATQKKSSGSKSMAVRPIASVTDDSANDSNADDIKDSSEQNHIIIEMDPFIIDRGSIASDDSGDDSNTDENKHNSRQNNIIIGTDPVTMNGSFSGDQVELHETSKTAEERSRNSGKRKRENDDVFTADTSLQSNEHHPEDGFDKFGHRNFLLSLLPAMNSIGLAEGLRLRQKLLSEVYSAVTENSGR